MAGLTTLGVFHTMVSLVALGAGIVCLARHRASSFSSALDKVCVAGTAVVCLTGFGPRRLRREGAAS